MVRGKLKKKFFFFNFPTGFYFCFTIYYSLRNLKKYIFSSNLDVCINNICLDSAHSMP